MGLSVTKKYSIGFYLYSLQEDGYEKNQKI